MKKGKQLIKVLLCVAVCALFWFFKANTAAAAVTAVTCDSCGKAMEEKPGSPATCTKDGVIPYVCAPCQQTKKVIIPGGHAWGNWTTTKEAACEETGMQQRSCRVCKQSETATIPAKNHSWGGWTTTKAATCEKTGTKKRECSVCPKTETNTIPAKNHIKGNSATCETAQKCTRKNCGKIFQEALGHEMDDASCFSPARCKRTGCTHTEGDKLEHILGPKATCETPQVCTREKCGYVEESALGHDKSGAPATCTTAQKCTRSGCDAIIETALGHNPGESATCTTPQKCTRSDCGATIKDALGHDWDEASCFTPATCKRCRETKGSPKGHTWQAATCKAPKTCTVCGYTEGDKADHVPLTGATCTSDSTCRTCGKVLVEALKHIPGEAATCETAQVCTRSNCGEVLEKALGHEEGASATCTKAQLCTRCNKTIKTALDHDWSEATCFAPKTCKRTGCGAKTGSPKGHTWQAATCKAPKTCTTCGYTEGGLADHVELMGATCTSASICRTCGTELHEALGHVPGPEATCTSIQKCTRYGCGIKLADKTPHKYETITIAAGCLTNGLEQEKCVCGNVKSSKVLPMLGHDWKDWKVVTEATCEEDGYRTHACKRCPMVISETIEKLGHDYVNGVCTRVGCRKYENYAGVKVTFDANGGSGGQYINAIDVIPGETYGKLPAGPTRAGYTFDGWYTAKSSGTKVTESTKVTKTTAHTLYAHWTAGKYTIQFYGNGNTAGNMNSITVNFGEKIKLPKNTFKKTGYIFAGWNEKADGTGKGYLDEASVENLTTVNNGKIALYAQWVEGYYTINYDANGGTGAPPSQKATIGKTGNLSRQTPTREGYEFVGWSLRLDGTSLDYQPGDVFPKEDHKSSVRTAAKSNGEVTLHAIWAEKIYTVTFHPNGGEGKVEDVTVFSDGKVSYIPKYTREGYELVGWGRSAGEGRPELDIITYPAGEDIIVDGNMNLYAKWKVQTYEIKYDLQGGTSSKINSTIINVGKTVKIYSETPTRDGYEFVGWAFNRDAIYPEYQSGDVFPKASDESKVNMIAKSNGEVTLYAIWADKYYTVMFYPNGGEGEPIPKMVARGEKVYEVPEFSRPGYEFVGWSCIEGDKGLITYEPGKEIVVTGDLNLYARWSAISYKVSFDLQGGTANPPITARKVTGGKKICLSFTEPKMEGYVFKGWSWTSSDREAAYQPGGVFPREGDLYIDANNTKDVTLFAIWERAVYTVTYYSDKGKILDTKSYLSNTEMVLPEIDLPKVEDDYYTRLCWIDVSEGGNDRKYDEGEVVKVKGNMEFKVGRKAREYKITYDLNGGTWGNGIESQTIKAGDKLLSLPTKPSKKYYRFVGWSTQEDLLVTYQPGDVFPNEDGVYYEDERDMDEITLHAVWTLIADEEMILGLQEEYGEKVMGDEYFLSVQEPSSWRPLGNGAWGIVRTTVEENDGNTCYHSTVYVIHKYEGDIRIEVYGSFGRFKDLIELRCLEYDSNFGLLIITGTRLLDNVIMKEAKTWLHAGEKAFLLSKDCIVYIDSVIELAAKCITGEEDLSTYVSKVDATKIVYKGITVPYNTVRSYIDVIASINDKKYVESLINGSDSTNRMMSLCTKLEKFDASKVGEKIKNGQLLVGCILDVADIWALAYDSNMQNLDVNGDNDVVVAYAMNMLRDAGFSEDAVNDTINALENVYAGK